jgi:hypothetical protein
VGCSILEGQYVEGFRHGLPVPSRDEVFETLTRTVRVRVCAQSLEGVVGGNDHAVTVKGGRREGQPLKRDVHHG